MKKISEVITQGQRDQWKGSKESKGPPDTSVIEMNYLFGVLAIEYPFFMPKADSDLVKKRNMWISLLRPYDRNQRMKALEKCLKHYTNKGGPSVGEYLKLLKVDPAHQDYKALPPPPVNETKQQIQMKRIREILKGESDEHGNGNSDG